MQELKFEQVEVVSGGVSISPYERDNYFNNECPEGSSWKESDSRTVSQESLAVGIGAALGLIHPVLGVAGATAAHYLNESAKVGQCVTKSSYPTYEGGPFQQDSLL